MEIRYWTFLSFFLFLFVFVGLKIAKYIYCVFGLKSNNINFIRCAVFVGEDYQNNENQYQMGFPGFWWKHLLLYEKQEYINNFFSIIGKLLWNFVCHELKGWIMLPNISKALEILKLSAWFNQQFVV